MVREMDWMKGGGTKFGKKITSKKNNKITK